MLLSLQKGIIYGPVHSRRLGLSLGINLLPTGVKACPFDCLYCQYGWTGIHKAHALERDSSLPLVRAVETKLREALVMLSRKRLQPAYLTFSGNGEPTLHPDFGRMVDVVRRLRDELVPEAKTAVLSNSALVSEEKVRRALLKLDRQIMKLDCGDGSFFKRYNRPCRGVELDRITQGLIELAREAPLTIQVLFTSGKRGNHFPENIRPWIERLKRIRPSSVQIYTLDRDGPVSSLGRVSADELQQVGGACEEEGIPAEVYG